MVSRFPALLAAMTLVTALTASPAFAAQAFATPAFQQRWEQDEALTPNFWGPLATARDGQQEPYSNAPGGTRLVQYFDKGRMEQTTPGGPVSSGLLVMELMTGRLQTGDTTFDQRAPAAVPVVGDPSNTLYYRDLAIANYVKPQIGQLTQNVLNVSAGGRLDVMRGGTPEPPYPTDPAATITTIDAQTGHGVAQVFDAFRARVGLAVVGLAVTEPFWTTAQVGGQTRTVLVEAFERRVLTYNSANPDPFKVEFGNVGQQYYRWRYGTVGP